MATGLRNFYTDENAIDKVHKQVHATKIFKAPSQDNIQKRPALGELGNKALVSNSGSLINKIKEATAHDGIKAKVDTNWKNHDGRKLIRTESLRSIKNTVSSTELNGPVKCNKLGLRNGNVKVNPTVVSKHVVKEQKPAISKVARQAVTKKDEVQSNKNTAAKKDEVHVLRREESNLSRRSLTKLRAALTKDAQKKDAIISTKTESNIATRRVVTKQNLPTVDCVKSKSIEKVKVKENYLTSPRIVKMKSKVEDIDANDFDNIFALSEYVNDIYNYLNELEDTFCIEENFMENQTEVTPRMRTVLLDWINEVAHQFRLISETYQITVGIIDRYLQIIPNTTRGQLQLVGVTALFIATKFEELYSSDIGDFIYMTDNSYTKQEILDMEKKIMRALDFQLSRPFPLQFLRRFSKAIGADQLEHLLAKYILELVSIEYNLVHYKPSEIAAAALYLSAQLLNMKRRPKDSIWNETVIHYSGYNSVYLKPLVKKVAFVLKNAPKSKTKSIYLKYKSEKFSKISTRSELYGTLIDSIIGSY